MPVASVGGRARTNAPDKRETAWAGGSDYDLAAAGSVRGSKVFGIHPADPLTAAGRELHLAPRLLTAPGKLDATGLRLEHMHDRGLERWLLVHLEAVGRRD